MRDSDALAVLDLLSDSSSGMDLVSGLDLVGAIDASRPRFRGNTEEAAATIRNAIKVKQMAKAAKAVEHEDRQRKLARANQMPAHVLGIDSRRQFAAPGLIGAGLTVTLTLQPGSRVRVVDFQAADTIADLFLIHEIKINRTDLLVGTDPVPARAFGSDAKHPPLRSPVCEAGSIISVQVENIDAGAQSFFGNFWVLDLHPEDDGEL